MCEVVHETNKAHFRNLLPNRFLPNSVGTALVMIGRLWVQTPLGTIFAEINFVLCNFRSVRQSDTNASDFLIVKNSIGSALSMKWPFIAGYFVKFTHQLLLRIYL